MHNAYEVSLKEDNHKLYKVSNLSTILVLIPYQCIILTTQALRGIAIE
jgi:hypothetical protein